MDDDDPLIHGADDATEGFIPDCCQGGSGPTRMMDDAAGIRLLKDAQARSKYGEEGAPKITGNKIESTTGSLAKPGEGVYS